MVLPEMRLVQSAIVLAEELNFSRAAERLGVHQSALSRYIAELEGLLEVLLFERDHRKVELTAAGRKFVADVRPAIELIERAMVSARAASDGAGEVLNIGRSAYTDPWLAAVVRSVHLPLYPGLRINWSSRYSHEVAHEVSVGTLDLGITTGVPEAPTLTFLRLAEHPLYIAMSRRDPLAANRELRLADAHNRTWILLAKQASPYMYDSIRHTAAKAEVSPFELHHVMGAEEAVPLILESNGLAFLTRAGAWRIARDGITMRPLAEENLKLVTNLAVRADSKSRLVRDFVKATAQKMESLRKPAQTRLPLIA
ncbi:MAG: LysR family transcriptional regulator [Candidatus Acidiferrales bacterium]